MPDFAAELRRLAAELDLQLTSAGEPANPLITVDLDRWREAPAESVRQAARLVAGALPITVGVLTGRPNRADLEPLITAVTLTLATEAAPWEGRWTAQTQRAIIDVGDLPQAPDRDEAGPQPAVERVREAVLWSPRAAIACGQLVRQTAVLGTSEGLAAEAAAYSLLLGGAEFRRWLDSRGAARSRPRPAATEPVLIRRDGTRLSIVLNVPQRRNAFSAAVREALLDAVLLAEADQTIESVELSGAGPAFCSGGDLDEFGRATDLVAAWLVRLARAPWRVIDRIAPKVAVRAQGACVGAGAEIAAYAGRVVASPDAFFALPEVGMGLVPGAGGSVSVVRRIGRWRAAWLMLTGERLPAATALRWGLVDEIAPARSHRLQRPESLEDAAQQVRVGDHTAARRRLHDLDQVLVEEVAEQDADNADRQADDRADFSHADGDAAQLQDLRALGAGDRRGLSQPRAADDHIDQVEVPRGPRPGAAAGHHVRPGHRAGVLVGVSVVLAHDPRRRLPGDRILDREPGVRDHVLADSLDQDFHLVGDLARVGVRVQDDRDPHAENRRDQVVEQPVQLAQKNFLRSSLRPTGTGSGVSPDLQSVSSGVPAARPLRNPCWIADMSERACSGSRAASGPAGAVGRLSRNCGAMLVCGARRGRPAACLAGACLAGTAGDGPARAFRPTATLAVFSGLSARSNSGGFASRSFSVLIVSGGMPRPRSSISPIAPRSTSTTGTG